MSVLVQLCLWLFLCLSSSSALPRPGRRLVGLRPPPLLPGAEVAEAQWLQQRLDHFSDRDTRTWRQRYFVNSSLWEKESGPVFLMLGGEGPANPAWLATDTDMMRNAAKFGALVFLLEHRLQPHARHTHTHTLTHMLQVLWREPSHSRCISGQSGLPVQQTSPPRCCHLQGRDGSQVLPHCGQSVGLVWRVLLRGPFWLAPHDLPRHCGWRRGNQRACSGGCVAHLKYKNQQFYF